MDVVAPIPQSAGQATLGEVIAEAQWMLEQAGVESSRQEAFWIVEHVLRLSAHHVVADRNRLLSHAELLVARGLVERRAPTSSDSILVLEDDPEAIRLIRHVLGAAGAELDLQVGSE